MYLLYIYLYVGKNNSFIVYLCVCVCLCWGLLRLQGSRVTSSQNLTCPTISFKGICSTTTCQSVVDLMNTFQLSSVQQCLPLQRSTMMLFLDSISIECICVSCVTERWYGVMFVSRLCNQKEQRLSFESETLAYWCVSVLMNYEQHQRLHIKCRGVVFVMFFGQQRGTVHVN